MSVQRQLSFWLLFFLAFLGFVTLFSSILPPFVGAMILAYLMDPFVSRLEKRGFSRLTASGIILVFFGFFVFFIILTVLPLLIDQFSSMLSKIPDYISMLQAFIVEKGGVLIEKFGGTSSLQDIQGQLASNVSSGAKWFGNFLASLASGGKAVVNLISFIVLTPIIAFYLLLDWRFMVARVDSWLPLAYRNDIMALFREMDASVAGFLRGQATICLILGCYYAVSLSLLGVHFGFTIGIMTGIIGFIPYIGALTGSLVSFGVTAAHSGADWTMLAGVAGIFICGQIIEGYILQPRLIGHAIGLHPVWLMFALFAGGSLFGLLGVMLAVPLAASIGVLVRFGLRRYLSSSFYLGVANSANGEQV